MKRMRGVSLCCVGVISVLGLAPATAADVPVKSPSYISPVPVSHWTGFYVGIHAGAIAGHFRNNGINAGPADTGTSFMGGGQFGYNFQSGRVVYGVEADLSAMDVYASTAAIGDFREKWTGSVRGRLGYAVEDLLLYVTAGVAYTHLKTSLTAAGTSGSSTVAGLAAGFGVEKMFAPHWSGRVEALFIDVPKHTFTITGGPVVGGSHNYALRAGLNYLFN